jgi:glycosyltransferase involved in cell wall biosynthesis
MTHPALLLPAYVLVTPARNEARFIELTIQSVVAQTVRPLRWVIVSDGSTDGTDEIVLRYAAQHDWIELVRMPERIERHFAGKVNAINAGLAQVKHLTYEVFGSLDADISFDRDYFAFLLEKLAADPSLGLVGTPYRNTASEVYDFRFVSTDHVSGACQVFRRTCFEAIGGYQPVKVGTIDTIAGLAARMHGWKTRTFTEKISLHHRMGGTAEASSLRARFVVGTKDYALGNHPLWQLFRGIYQMTKKPYVIRGLTMTAGYLWSAVRRVERPIAHELVEFRRKEEMDHLAKMFLRMTPRWPGRPAASQGS